MAAPVIAMLNMKGGVGKTTIAAHVSRELFEAKQVATLIVDLDPQFNLTQCIISRDRYESLVKKGQTALRVFEPAPTSNFFDVNTKGEDPPDAYEISEQLFYFKNLPDKVLRVVPGSFDLTKYSIVSDKEKLDHASKYFKRFINAARSKFDIIILDMNPSSSFLTIAGLSVATDVFSPVKPDKYSLLGLELVKRIIDHPVIDGNPNIHVLMNSVKRNEPITDVEVEIRSHSFFGDRVLASRLYESNLLRAMPDYTGFASDKRVPYRSQIRRELRTVALELAGKVGL